MINWKRSTANTPFISACLVACLFVSATLSVAGRIAHDEQADGRGTVSRTIGEKTKFWAMGNRWADVEESKSGHYVTRAKVNGANVWALIDTGSSSVSLSYEDAEAAGLNPFRLKFNHRVQTANGITKAARVTLDQVIVDNIMIEGVEGMVMRKGAMDGTLLGMSFLNRLNGFRVDSGVLVLEK